MTDTYGDARAVAHKLIERIAMPIDICGDSATVGASVGIALFTPGSDTSAADLLKEADRWMYEAKKAGRGRVLPDRWGHPAIIRDRAALPRADSTSADSGCGRR